MGFNATFNSISAISWRRKPERTADLGQVTDKPYRVRLHTFCCLQSGARTHNPDVIGYSDYTGKPTTLTTRPPPLRINIPSNLTFIFKILFLVFILFSVSSALFTILIQSKQIYKKIFNIFQGFS